MGIYSEYKIQEFLWSFEMSQDSFLESMTLETSICHYYKRHVLNKNQRENVSWNSSCALNISNADWSMYMYTLGTNRDTKIYSTDTVILLMAKHDCQFIHFVAKFIFTTNDDWSYTAHFRDK